MSEGGLRRLSSSCTVVNARLLLNGLTERYFRRGRCATLFLLSIYMLLLPGCGEQQLPPESEGVLTYAAINPVSTKLKRSIERFNEAHPDTPIEIHDYSEEGGMERLQTELVLGKVPDIMELRAGDNTKESWRSPDQVPGVDKGSEDYMPYRQLAMKGYLEDLWPYIENDPELGREAVLEAPLKAAEVNGGLYMLFDGVEIFTLTGRASVVGERYSWTLDDIMEVYAAMPEDSTILRYNITRKECFYNLLCNSLERFIDRETGESTFDSEEFRTLVGFLETLPDKADDKPPAEAEEEVIRRIQNGTQMLEGMAVLWPDSIALSDGLWQERAAFPGYPTTDGNSGSFFYLKRNILGMSATCRNKDAAWAYIRTLITPCLIGADVFFNGIPVNLHDYEKICRYVLRRTQEWERLWAGRPEIHYMTTRHFQYGPEVPLLDFPSEKENQRHRELIDHTTQIFWPEDELSNIVWDTLGPYFARDKTWEQTVNLLQNRVKIYLDENR